MAEKPTEAEEKAAEAEFQRVLGNLAAMPPKPHEPLGLRPKRKPRDSTKANNPR